MSELKINAAGSTATVAGVIISFNPPAELVSRVQSLAEAFGHIVIVDNASGNEAWPQVRAALLKQEKVRLVENPGNLGQARALNQAMALCRTLGYAWAMTLDQDSSVTIAVAHRMIDALARYEPKEKLAVLSPCHFDPIEGVFRRPGGRYSGDGFIRGVETAITSGNIVSIAVAERVGLYREEYFIDWVDHEFCARCRSRGFDIVVTVDAVLVHSVGQPQESEYFLYRRYTSHYSPVRLYYSHRNAIRTYLEYRKIFPQWANSSLRKVLNRVKKVLLLEPNRWTNAKMILRGMIDGVRGKMGPYPY